MRRVQEPEVIVTGVGWIAGSECGSVRKGKSGAYESLDSLHTRLCGESVLPNPIRHFGRFDFASKLACCAVALALEDASGAYTEEHKGTLGIVGTDAQGAYATNVLYFADYLENGRTLARGNLFVYTLASSPLAAAAIHFGCQGPVSHMIFLEENKKSLLRFAARLIGNREAPGMLALCTAGANAVCFLLRQLDEDSLPAVEDQVCELGAALRLAGSQSSLLQLVAGLKRRKSVS